MSRAKWKGPYLENELIYQIDQKNKPSVFTTSRKSTIVPNFVGKTFAVTGVVEGRQIWGD